MAKRLFFELSSNCIAHRGAFLESPAWEDGGSEEEPLKDLGAAEGEGLIGRQVGRYQL